MTSKDIPLKLNPGTEQLIKGFTYTAIGGNQNLFVDLNGRYGNKTVISNFSGYSWKSTRSNLIDALKEKGVTPKDIASIIDVLDSNGKSILEALGQDEDNKDEEENKRESVKVLEFLEPIVSCLFKNQFDIPFATILVNNDHYETLPIHRNIKFERWVCGTYYKYSRRTFGSEVLKEVCTNLESRAQFDGDTKTLELRVSKDPKDELTYYYDLTNPKWEVVKITADGWSVEQSDKVPIMFRRFSSQRAQVYPSRSRDYPADIFDQFFNLLNVSTDEDMRLLLKCYIVSLFIPDISKVILILYGDKGAAKSAGQYLIKALVDPSPLEELTPPRDEDRLVQQLSHNYVAYYGNVSYIKSWLSDALCRATTGAADSKRQLYTDDDDILYQFIRCIGLNGITLAANKADLLDRSIIAELLRIDKKKRRNFKSDILLRFNKIKPQLLAYIFDILVEVLRLKDAGGIHLESKERMADFEEHAEMIARCMGYEPLEFVKVYEANKTLATGEALEGSPIARALIDFMDDKERWEGSMTELLSELETIAFRLKINTKEKLWPKAANALSGRIAEVKPDLSEVGISISYTKHPRTRLKHIIIGRSSSASSDRPQGENHAQNGPKSADDDEKRSSADASTSSAEGAGTNDHRDSANDDFTGSSAEDNQSHAHISSDITSDERSNDPNDHLPSSFAGGSSD